MVSWVIYFKRWGYEEKQMRLMTLKRDTEMETPYLTQLFCFWNSLIDRSENYSLFFILVFFHLCFFFLQLSSKLKSCFCYFSRNSWSVLVLWQIWRLFLFCLKIWKDLVWLDFNFALLDIRKINGTPIEKSSMMNSLCYVNFPARKKKKENPSCICISP